MAEEGGWWSSIATKRYNGYLFLTARYPRLWSRPGCLPRSPLVSSCSTTDGMLAGPTPRPLCTYMVPSSRRYVPLLDPGIEHHPGWYPDQSCQAQPARIQAHPLTAVLPLSYFLQVPICPSLCQDSSFPACKCLHISSSHQDVPLVLFLVAFQTAVVVSVGYIWSGVVISVVLLHSLRCLSPAPCSYCPALPT